MNEYKLEKGDGWFSIEKELSKTSPEEAVEYLEENYGFERDSSGDLHHLYRENMEVSYQGEKAKAVIYTEEEPDDWLLEGISAMMEGEKVPLDTDYFSKEDYLSELKAMDFPYQLDRDDEEHAEGVTTETSPKL